MAKVKKKEWSESVCVCGVRGIIRRDFQKKENFEKG